MSKVKDLIIQSSESNLLEQINIMYALRSLTYNGFKLYLYLAYKSGQGKFYFSPKDFISFTGSSNSSARRAVEELLEKNFLQPSYDEGYYFCLPNSF